MEEVCEEKGEESRRDGEKMEERRRQSLKANSMVFMHTDLICFRSLTVLLPTPPALPPPPLYTTLHSVKH